MRSTGLDELPQLFNVLRGEMSLVGPRPCPAQEYDAYSLPQKARFDVLPGLTGLWQVRDSMEDKESGAKQYSFHPRQR